jgi:hypothetical protein
VLDAHEHLDPARNGDAVGRYSMVLARIERVYRWLSERDDPVFADAAKGRIHAVYERLERWERQADLAEEKLALAPLTRARLGLGLHQLATAADALQAHLRQRYDLDGSAAVDDG